MRESLSDSNRSSNNLEKSGSQSSSTSSEQWLLSYPFTTMDAPRSPLFKSSSPSRLSRSSLEKSLTKQCVVNGDDDVFILENGLPNGIAERIRLNSGGDWRKSTASSGGRSSLGENSVMYDFVSSILDELNTDGVVKLDAANLLKQKKPNRKADIDRVNRDKSNALMQQQNGHCKLEDQPEDKCNSSKDVDRVQESECNTDVSEVRPVRTFSLGSGVESQTPVSVPAITPTDAGVTNSAKRTNSPSRIPKATPKPHMTPSNFIGQSIKRMTSPKEHNSESIVGEEKEKKKELKVKSKIPQLIRNSFRQKSSSKKKGRFPKVDIIRSSQSLQGNPKLSPIHKKNPSPILSPKLNGSPRLTRTNLNDEPKLNGSSSSPKLSHSPHLSQSPRLCASPRMAGSPLLNGSPLSLCNGFSDSLDSLGCLSFSNGGNSRKSSVASTSSSFCLIDNLPNVPYIDDSSSSPESLSNRNSKDADNDLGMGGSNKMQISSPMTTAYRALDGVDFRERFDKKSALDDQISPEMIEDIKQGRLASNWDSLSLGVNHQSSTSQISQYNMKNSYSWSESIPKERAVSEPPPPPPCIDTLLGDHTSDQCKDEAEAEPCKVPLVNEDMMEDFEVDDMCGEDDTGSIRENSAQLTEKVIL